MPWQECNRMEERVRFIARMLDGEKMAPLCREFGISRKTGYKIFNRFKEFGLRGLEDQPRSAVSGSKSHSAEKADENWVEQMGQNPFAPKVLPLSSE